MRTEMLNIEASHKGFLEELVKYAFDHASDETQEIVLQALRNDYTKSAWIEKVTTAKKCAELKLGIDRRLAEARAAKIGK